MTPEWQREHEKDLYLPPRWSGSGAWVRFRPAGTGPWGDYGDAWSLDGAGFSYPAKSLEDARAQWERMQDSWEKLPGHGPPPDPETARRAGQAAAAAIPAGELWQECSVRGCRTEPVNLCCERCDRHCHCRDDAREAAELEAAAPGLQAKIAEYDDMTRRGIE